MYCARCGRRTDHTASLRRPGLGPIGWEGWLRKDEFYLCKKCRKEWLSEQCPPDIPKKSDKATLLFCQHCGTRAETRDLFQRERLKFCLEYVMVGLNCCEDEAMRDSTREQICVNCAAHFFKWMGKQSDYILNPPAKPGLLRVLRLLFSVDTKV